MSQSSTDPTQRTVYEILPADRTWPPDIEHAAQALADAAADPYERAALSILLRYDAPRMIALLHEANVVIELTAAQAGIGWPMLAALARSWRLTVPEHERALVLLACSLADANIAVPIAQLYAQLRGDMGEIVLDATAHVLDVTR